MRFRALGHGGQFLPVVLPRNVQVLRHLSFEVLGMTGRWYKSAIEPRHRIAGTQPFQTGFKLRGRLLGEDGLLSLA